MMTRMEQVKAGVSEGEDSFNNVQKVLQKYGMTLLDTAGQFKPLEDVIDEMGQKWSTLDKFQQMQLVTAVAGARQANSMVALMDNYSNALQYQTEEVDSAGLESQRYQTYQESLAASEAKFTDSLNAMWSATINQNFIKTIIDAGTAVLTFIANAGGLVPLLTTIIGLIVVFNAQNLAGMFGGIGKAIQSFILILQGAGTALETTTGIIGAIIAIISLAVAAYNEWGNTAANAAKKVEAANQALADTTSKLKDLKDQTNNIKDLSDQYEDLAKKTRLSTEEQQSFTDVQNQLKNVLPTIAGYYDQTGNFIIDPKALSSNQAYLDLINQEIAALQTKQFLEAKEQSKANANAYNMNENQTKDLSSQNNGWSYNKFTGETSVKQLSQDQIDANNAQIAANKATDLKMVQDDVDAYNQATSAQKKALEQQYANEGDYGKKVLSVINGNVKSAEEAYASQNADIEAAEANIGNATSEIADHTADDLKKITDAADTVESSTVSSFKSMQTALEDYDKTGEMSLSQANDLISAGYGQAVSIDAVTGAVSVNIPLLQQLALAQVNDTIAAKEGALAKLSLAEASGVVGQQILAEINVLNAEKTALSGQFVDVKTLIGTLSNFTGASVSAGGATKDLNAAQKQAYEDQIKGINKEVDALNKQTTALNDQKKAYDDIISAQKQQLQLEKEKNDYEDELKTKNKELADIDNELIQIQYDNSEEGNAKRLALEDQRAAKVTEINEAEADNTYNLQTEALDAEQAAYDKMIENQVAGINSVIDGYKDLISTIQDLIDALGKVSSVGSGSTGTSTATTKKTTSTSVAPKTTQATFNATAAQYANQYIGYSSGGSGKVPSGYPNDSAMVPVESDEVFAVLNKSQQSQFATSPLASMFQTILGNSNAPQFTNANNGSGDVTVTIPIAVNGSLDKTVLPEMKEMVTKIMVDTLKKRGVTRNATSFSV